MEHTTEFDCAECGAHKVHTSRVTTGYGTDDKGRKVCFDCCGKADRGSMEQGEPICLYLSTANDTGHKLTNWPGTLSIPIRHVKTGRHNIAGKRYDVWFRFAGHNWHGVQYGDNTQLCHCRTVKK